MYVHVCTCMYVHVCTSMYVCMYVCTCMYMYICTCASSGDTDGDVIVKSGTGLPAIV